MRNLIIGFILIACISANAQTEIRNDSTIIKSKLRIRNHNEGNGKVLTSDALGNASWQSPASSTNFWQIGSTSTEAIPNSPITKIRIPGSFQITTGAASGRYLRSDATGNATWASLPAFTLSLPYSDGINSTSTAFNINNLNTTGYAFHSVGNLKLQNINEAPGRILFSTDDQGDAKWENGNCISKCTFSLTRNLKASIPSGSVQFLPFTIESFDICNASTFVNVAGDNDFHYYTAPLDGIYQFSFNGSFQTSINYSLSIHKLNASNLPATQIFASLCQGNTTEIAQRYTAIVRLNAGDKIAPTIIGANPTGSIAFNNSDNPLSCTFSGNIIETTDCTALKAAK
jgi:hypothetical protein